MLTPLSAFIVPRSKLRRHGPDDPSCKGGRRHHGRQQQAPVHPYLIGFLAAAYRASCCGCENPAFEGIHPHRVRPREKGKAGGHVDREGLPLSRVRPRAYGQSVPGRRRGTRRIGPLSVEAARSGLPRTRRRPPRADRLQGTGAPHPRMVGSGAPLVLVGRRRVTWRATAPFDRHPISRVRLTSRRPAGQHVPLHRGVGVAVCCGR
jgi:hypothetical protein